MATQWKIRTIVVAVGMALAAPGIALAGSPPPSVTSTAHTKVTSSQTAVGSSETATNSVNRARASNHVLQNAKGNVGVNIAAGNGNMQVNNTGIAVANTSTTTASSAVDNVQWSNIFSSSDSTDVTNNAGASNHVLQNASGNIGLNAAAGADNMQANNTALSVGLGVLPSGQASASIESAQLSGPFTIATAGGDNNTASLSNHVLQNAKGNIGVNVAAGDENMQANNLAVSYNRGGLHAIADVGSLQAAGFIEAMTFGGSNDATLSNHVLQNASGNIGVNVAAGQQNMQENSLALATAPAVQSSSSSSTDPSTVDVASSQNGGFFSGSLTVYSDNHASLTNHVLQSASGNIGVNAAAGDENMQANNTGIALTRSPQSGGTASSSVTSNQNAGPFVGSFSFAGSDSAYLANHVLQNATGNIGVNVAAGADNMQANNLGYAYNSAGQSATSAIDNDQGVEGGDFSNSARTSFTLYGRDRASLSNHVLQNATGNIGANVAAGQWNEQGNNLSIAATGGPDGNATATIADNQASNMALWYWYGPSTATDSLGRMTASLSNHVLQNAKGNIGVNAAAGVQNVQANNTAIALGSGGSATAMIGGAQTSGPYSLAYEEGASNAASVTNHVLQNASGKIGANVAAGMQNMQSNDLAYAFNRAGTNAGAFSQVSQVSMGAIAVDQPVRFDCGLKPVTNTASVSNDVMQNVSGDVGLNVAAGAANMQRNTLTIADAK